MGKIILNDIEYGIGISNGVNVDTTNLVKKDNIVTTLDDTVTDEQIPSAKAVHTVIQNVNVSIPADVYSKTEVDDLLADKADSTDIIDAYSKTEVDNLLNDKADTDDLVDAYSKTEVNNLLANKADSSALEQLEDTLTDYPTLEYLEEVKTELENEITNIPKVTKTSELTNDSGFITANDIPDVDLEPYALKTEIPTTLPASDVYAWAKASTKPTYTASEVGALASNGTAVNASKVNNALTLQIAGTTKNTFNGSSAQTFNIPNASTSTAGVMTTEQVTKLNGIATGATKNTVDTAMSSTSTNAVQNKVIYAYIQEQINNLANGGISVIKSIQRGTSIIESGDYYRDVRIDAVNVNKAMVNYLGFTGASNDSSSEHKYRCYIKLTDSTTLTIRRADEDGSDYTCSWEVIEFY